mmetsp:Transcript_3530/g.14419  ORF Transcript_3530/g.14419 Transcript_3530/m.14419 type:complete len:213 (-) Transcript_3530:169-807(-)
MDRNRRPRRVRRHRFVLPPRGVRGPQGEREGERPGARRVCSFRPRPDVRGGGGRGRGCCGGVRHRGVGAGGDATLRDERVRRGRVHRRRRVARDDCDVSHQLQPAAAPGTESGAGEDAEDNGRGASGSGGGGGVPREERGARAGDVPLRRGDRVLGDEGGGEVLGPRGRRQARAASRRVQVGGGGGERERGPEGAGRGAETVRGGGGDRGRG